MNYKGNHPLGYEYQFIFGTDKEVLNIVEDGADLNELGMRGSSYLWICMVHSKYDRCLLLLELGADPYSDKMFRDDIDGTIKRYETYEWGGEELKLLHRISEYLDKYDMAIKIQKSFRMHLAKLVVTMKRLEPRFLFEPEYSNIRKRKYEIDDSRFKQCEKDYNK